MNEDSQVKLSAYLDVLYRHRLAMVCTFGVCLIFTLAVAVLLPKRYMSSTLVTIQPQAVAAQYVSAPSSSHLEDRLKALESMALSRTHLESIIDEFKLYGPLRAREPIEEVVDYMRRHIAVEITPGSQQRAGSGFFRLSFEYGNPGMTQRVTARLADAFINEDFRERARWAADTTQFLDDQLGDVRSQLEAKEQQIKSFTSRYQGSLPQDMDSNIKLMGDLQGQLQKATQDFAVSQDRAAQLTREEALAQQQQLTITAANGQKSQATPQAALSSMKTQLAILRAQYSDSYPDVISLKAQIAALQRQIKDSPKSGDKDLADSPLDQQFRRQRDALALEQTRLQNEQVALKKQIGNLQTLIEQTPAHAEQLANLTRDYQVLSKHYDQLLSHKLAAQMEQSLEQRQEGERFQVIDPANLPEKPLPPSRMTVLMMGSAASVILALALPFGLAMVDSSVKEADELRTQCNLPVIAAIPRLREIEGFLSERTVMLRAVAISAATVAVGISGLWFYLHNIF